MLFRLGSALILIGTLILVVFALTLSAGVADLRAFLAGAGLAIVGLLIHSRARRVRPEPARRFRTLRRLLGEAPPDDGPFE